MYTSLPDISFIIISHTDIFVNGLEGARKNFSTRLFQNRVANRLTTSSFPFIVYAECCSLGAIAQRYGFSTGLWGESHISPPR